MTRIPDFFATQSNDLQCAAKAAAAAGKVIRAGYQQVHQIDAKGIGDLVSQVDFDADRDATQVLRDADPALTIISEELNPDAGDDRTAANFDHRFWNGNGFFGQARAKAAG